MEGYELYSGEERSGKVEQRNRPTMLADELAPFREGQYEVQEKRWLQQPRALIRPDDGPVKSIELAGIVQRAENERYQAENVKMRGTDHRPAPQQYIKPTAELHEADQP